MNKIINFLKNVKEKSLAVSIILQIFKYWFDSFDTISRLQDNEIVNAVQNILSISHITLHFMIQYPFFQNSNICPKHRLYFPLLLLNFSLIYKVLKQSGKLIDYTNNDKYYNYMHSSILFENIYYILSDKDIEIIKGYIQSIIGLFPIYDGNAKSYVISDTNMDNWINYIGSDKFSLEGEEWNSSIYKMNLTIYIPVVDNPSKNLPNHIKILFHELKNYKTTSIFIHYYVE